MIHPTTPIPLLFLLILLTSFPSFSQSQSSPSLPLLDSESDSINGITLPLFRNVRTLRLRKTNSNLLKEWALREKGKYESKYDLDGSDNILEKRRIRYLGDSQKRGIEGVDIRAATALATAGYGQITPTPTISDGGTTGGNNGTITGTFVFPAPTNVVGSVKVFNEEDLEYFAAVGVGVPPQFMNVILDTGSADLWIADSHCTNRTGCPNIPTYNSSASVTGVNVANDFSVRYGSGAASGAMWQDFVGFGGYNVSSQGFALVDKVSNGLLNGDISGLMGLGWQSLAASGVTPFWQNLFQASVLPFPGFAFQLTRFVNTTIETTNLTLSNNNQNSNGTITNSTTTLSQLVIESGGSLTIGYLNASLYIPPINYINLPIAESNSAQSYWLIPMDTIQVNNTNVTGVGTPLVAIDTGTTLIGGPQAVVSALYSMIPGALRATGAYAGYYSYPCGQVVNVTFGFGGKLYNMSSADFNLGSFGQQGNVSTCLGAFFDLNLSSTSKITWVIGAAFLKNVYSVYRASPPSVGFAYLSTNITSSSSNATNSHNNGNSYNITFPAGIFGPSAVIVQQPSLQTSVMAADSVTTAITAGQTVRGSSGSNKLELVLGRLVFSSLLMVGLNWT